MYLTGKNDHKFLSVSLKLKCVEDLFKIKLDSSTS